MALNMEQTTLRAYHHTQLKDCASLQWFQDALHTRSVSIVDTQDRDPDTATYHITNDTHTTQF